MKKVNYGISILIGVLIATLLFDNYNMWSREKSRHLNIVNVEKGKDIDLDLNVTPSLFGKKNRDVFDKMVSFLNEHDLDGYITMFVTEDDSGSIKSYFFTTPTPDYFKYMSVRDQKDVSVIFKEDDWVISNDLSRSDAYFLDFIDKDRYEFDGAINFEIEIRPIEKAKDYFSIENTQLLLKVSVPKGTEDFYTEEMELAFKEFMNPMSHGVLQSDEAIYEDYYPKLTFLSSFTLLPYSIIWLSLFLSLFLTIYISIYATKEIVIAYINGYSIYTILKDYYIKTIFNSTILFVLSLLATTWIISDSHQIAYLRFIKTLLPVIGIYVLLMILSVILSYGYLKFKFSSQILKEAHQVKISFWVIILLKILLILVILLPIVDASSSILNRSMYLELVEKSDVYMDTSNLSFSSQNMEDQKFEGAVEAIDNLIYNQEFHYFDHFESLLTHYDDLDDYYQTESNVMINSEYDFITVNTKYVKDILKINKIHDNLDTMYILAHSDHNLDELKSHNSNLEVIEYAKDITVLPTTTSSDHDNFGVLENPVIIVDNHAFKNKPYLENAIVDYGNQNNLKEKLDRIGDEFGLDFDVTHFSGNVRNNLKEQKEDTFLVRNLILIFIVMLPIFTYSAIKLYLSANGKTLVIEYMNGYSYFQRYGVVISNVITSSMIALAFVYKLLMNLKDVNISVVVGLTLFILGVDVLMIYFGIRTYERDNMPQILKGEN